MQLTAENITRVSMKIAGVALLTAFLFMINAAFMLSEAADDILVLDKGNDTVVTGTIITLDADDMTLRVGAKDIDVDLDDIDNDIDIKELLSEGQSVSVQGSFNNNRLKAKRVITSTSADTQAEIKAGIIADDIGDKGGD